MLPARHAIRTACNVPCFIVIAPLVALVDSFALLAACSALASALSPLDDDDVLDAVEVAASEVEAEAILDGRNAFPLDEDDVDVAVDVAFNADNVPT